MRIPTVRYQRFHFSPLRYPGGKAFLYPFLHELISTRDLRNLTYVEPFAGGAGAALALLFAGTVNRIIINDLDKSIYWFWKSAVFSSAEFIEKLLATPVTVREWRRQKRVLADPRSSTFDKGFATFFLNRTNVSGNLDGGPIGGLGQTGEWRVNARFNKQTLVRRLKQISAYRDRISVTNEDGVALIKVLLNRRNTFFYLDPPYFAKGATLYLNHFTEQDHKVLADVLNRHADSRWLLTYDNRREIRALYSRRRIISYSLNYTAYEARRGRELMIMSDVLSE